uniref:TSA: Wollemia nobilis Ref_Wollemi_Transcript_877_578 transcribed RNA sequence n=1 Tax=Wollemia nobilis TaxID=56998 RepID=A0A0C9SB45_9CONI
MKADMSNPVSPCGACKVQRKKCSDKCLLAPYFPSSDVRKFAIVYGVFGASNIVQQLHELPLEKRADAVSSMVYEATARLRDPVYGCAGRVRQLEEQVGELQAELLNLRWQDSGLTPFCPTLNGALASISDEMSSFPNLDELDSIELWEESLI